MAAHPRIVTTDVTFMWDGAPQRLARRTLIDVPPGSALEQAIGREHLVPLSGPPPVTPAPPETAPAPAAQSAEEAPQDDPQPAARGKSKAAAQAAQAKDSGTRDTDGS